MSDFNDIREYLKSIELSHLKLIASRINKDDTIKTSQPRSKIEKAISMRYLQNNNNSYAITKKDIRLLDSVKGRIIPKGEEQTTLSTVSAEPAEPATETLATEPRRKAGRPPGGTNPNAGRPKGSKNIRGGGEKWDKFKKYAIPIGATALALGAAYAGHKQYKGKQYQPSLNEKPLAMPHRYPNDIPNPDDIFSRDIIQPYKKYTPSTQAERNVLREQAVMDKEAEALAHWNNTIRDERIRGRGEKWDKFKKYAIPIGATALAIGAAYAGAKTYQSAMKEKPYVDTILNANSTRADMNKWYDRSKVYEARKAWSDNQMAKGAPVLNFAGMTDTSINNYMKSVDEEDAEKALKALTGKGKKKVSMKLDELLSEHKRIVSELAKIPSLKKEYNIQKREMKKYEIMKGNGIIGDFFKDQIKQQIDRYSLPFDVMRAVPFGTAIASKYVPYVEPASMLQGAIFGDRTSKRLKEIEGNENDGNENDGNEIEGNGEKWDKFKKYAIPIGATALALGALYAGHKQYKGQTNPSVYIPSSSTTASAISEIPDIPTDPQERTNFMNVKRDEFLANNRLERLAQRQSQAQADALEQQQQLQRDINVKALQKGQERTKALYDSAVLRASHSRPVSNAADADDRLRAQHTAPIPKSGVPQIQELPEQLGVAPPRSGDTAQRIRVRNMARALASGDDSNLTPDQKQSIKGLREVRDEMQAEQLGVAPPRSRGRPPGIPNPKGGRPKGSLNKSKKNDDDMSGNGIIGDFFKDQLNQQIDRYSLPFDVMRAIPFGTTIASAYVPYVGPASMLQGALFGDRTSKRLNRIEGFEGLGKLGKDGHGQRVILHGKEKEIKQTIQHLHNILSKTK